MKQHAHIVRQGLRTMAAPAVVAEAEVLERYHAELLDQGGGEGETAAAAVSMDPTTATLRIQGWRMAARRRPILSDQDKEALCHRIARYWARHGKTAASMVTQTSTSSTAAGGEGDAGSAPAAAATSDGNDDGTSPPPPSGHNFTPLPEILFGQSYLEALHEATGLGLRFNTAGALVRWARRHLVPPGQQLEILKVPEASRWAAANLAAGLKQVQYDWVFGTDYAGELLEAPGSSSSSSSLNGHSDSEDPADTQLDGADVRLREREEDEEARWEPAGAEVIDRALLQSREQPILFYADVPLYEDELHDHGAVQLSAKIRVMPTCWFVLLRYFLRVDGMLLRLHETRYFHRFGSGEVGRSTSHQEATFAQLRDRGLPADPSNYRDPNLVAQTLGPAPDAVHARLVLAPPS